MGFGTRLAILRNERGLTQAGLAEELCMSKRVLSYYESDGRLPKDEETYRKIADYFSCSLDWLFERTDVRCVGNCDANISSQNCNDFDEVIIGLEHYTDMLRKRRDSVHSQTNTRMKSRAGQPE